MFKRLINWIMSWFTTSFKQITPNVKVQITPKRLPRFITSFSNKLLDLLSSVKPIICSSSTCRSAKYPVEISRISYVCHKCGHYYPVIENRARRFLKSVGVLSNAS